MDSYEATRMVFSRIQNLDPENASKIIGYLLIQDHGEKEMIRLAFGPETLIHATIQKAKTHLGLPSSSSNPTTGVSTPSSSRPSPLSIPNSSSRLNNGGFDFTNPNSPFSSTNSPLSFVNGGSSKCNENGFLDDFQVQDQFSFFNESKGGDFHDPRLDLANGFADSRSFSVPGMCFGSEDANSGLGWKPCLYFAKGFCKNGTGCRFLHGDCADGGASAVVGSPNEFEQRQELLRAKALQQQQQSLASVSPFMAAGASFPYNTCLNFLLQQQNETQRALMMGEELHNFGRSCLQRNDFPAMGIGGEGNSPASRQIYLTFPAESTFREEDVTNYFSMFGPVQDVRIPYQQKRMFGFVTFVFAETVKMILAKGNPHFVCDSRVLVKPYKEKGKVLDKKQHQLERGEYSSSCSSPSGIVDSRDAFDLQLGTTIGPRMFYNNNQEALARRKLEEQAELQQALEFQGRRLLNLQLLEFNNNQFHHGLPARSPVPSPTVSSRASNHHARIFPVDGIDQELLPEENNGNVDAGGSLSKTAVANAEEGNPASNHDNDNGDTNSKNEKVKSEENDLPESLEHILPDNLFASPKKSTGDQITAFSTPLAESDETASSSNNNASLAALNSCFLPMPRFPSGHETIGM